MINVCIFSGGLDSTVLLYRLMERDRPVRAVSIDYGQRHGRRELEAAREIARVARVPHDVIDMSGIASLLPGSSQTDPDVAVPLGHYADPRMKATIVPNRNMLMISAAAAICLAHGGGSVFYGAHSGDHAVYPDCREEFSIALDQALRRADDRPINLERPFVSLTKTQIVKAGAWGGAPLEMTWSCYLGGDVHCGACGTCIERREAFRDAGIDDPTEYAVSAPDLDAVLASFVR